MTDADRTAAIGIDLGGHNLRAGLFDQEGTMISHRQVKTAEGRKVDDVLDQIVAICGSIRKDGAASHYDIVGVGVGVPGFLNGAHGYLYSSPNFPTWKTLHLGKLMQDRLSLPHVLENDANCAALGEWWKGAAGQCRNALCFTLGTGVGGGAVVNGSLLRGTHGAAGELGHIVVHPGGTTCGCGGEGCLETEASGGHLQKNTGLTAKELGEKAQAGDTAALEAFSEVGRYLGIAFSSCCQIFDPEVIVIGGRVSRAFEFFEPSLRAEMATRLGRHPSRSVRVLPAECGDNAGLLGAAYLAFQELSWSDPSSGDEG